MEERRIDRTEDAHRALERKVEPSSFEASGNASREAPAAEGLHVCPGCASKLVYPITWAPADRKHWTVSLRCPECEWHGGGTYGQDALEHFDEELDRGTDALVEDLQVLARANLQDEIDRFVEALRADQVLPEDF